MPNIKEIALKVADKSGAVAYSPAPLRAVRGYSFTYEQLQNFAEALIAELAEQNEPVAWATKRITDGAILIDKEDSPPTAFWSESFPVFTFPPTAEQIANETAEACASYLSSRAKPNLEAAQVMDDTVYAIRSGAWKEFKK